MRRRPSRRRAAQGQDALVQAAGPAAASDIRAAINEKSGLVYPDPGFVDRLMNWAPPPGYTPVITQGAKRRLVQPDLLNAAMHARRAHDAFRARNSRRVAARSRFARRRPDASVSSRWCA